MGSDQHYANTGAGRSIQPIHSTKRSHASIDDSEAVFSRLCQYWCLLWGVWIQRDWSLLDKGRLWIRTLKIWRCWISIIHLFRASWTSLDNSDSLHCDSNCNKTITKASKCYQDDSFYKACKHKDATWAGRTEILVGRMYWDWNECSHLHHNDGRRKLWSLLGSSVHSLRLRINNFTSAGPHFSSCHNCKVPQTQKERAQGKQVKRTI